MECANFAAGSKRAALVIAHPGHELRVHHWLEQAKPVVFVLTDGSGRTTQSRLASTSKILQQAGATSGSIYGRFPDAAIYTIMLKSQQQVILSLVEELANALVTSEINYVVGDALEGYNTSHDLCRYLIGAAVELAQRRSKRPIGNYDFLLTGRPDECPIELRDNAIKISLGDAAIERKLAAAQGYPELLHEVNGAMQQFGKTAFSTEWLRPVPNRIGLQPAENEFPYYEIHGEKQKTVGHYQYVIRLREHLLPLAQAMWDYVEQNQS
ncbi:MAG: hypothetical protein JWQ71_4215 [Pedosphaera sp.]|nr:hypothetical protein [Pedosphaera sp.]